LEVKMAVKKGNERVTVTLSEELYGRLEAYQDKYGVSITAQIQVALVAALKMPGYAGLEPDKERRAAREAAKRAKADAEAAERAKADAEAAERERTAASPSRGRTSAGGRNRQKK
jgi:hypothetical protein